MTAPPACHLHSHQRQGAGKTGRAKDPICGMFVPKATALSTQRGGATTTSAARAACRRSRIPTKSWASSAGAWASWIGGVLALLWAGAFVALAAGVSLVSWVPLPALPWMSWGKWLFALATAVQFIGG